MGYVAHDQVIEDESIHIPARRVTDSFRYQGNLPTQRRERLSQFPREGGIALHHGRNSSLHHERPRLVLSGDGDITHASIGSVTNEARGLAQSVLIVKAHLGRGDLRQAEEEVHILLVGYRETYGENSFELSVGLSLLADIMFAQKNYVEAIEIYKRAIQIRERDDDIGHEDLLDLYFDIAMPLLRLDRLTESSGYFDKAVDLAAGSSEDNIRSLLMSSVDRYIDENYKLGRNGIALLWMRRAIALTKEMYGEDSLEYANKSIDIASTFATLGCELDARQLRIQAINALGVLAKKDQAKAAEKLEELAKIYQIQSKSDLAQMALDELLIVSVMPGVDPRMEARAYYLHGFTSISLQDIPTAISCLELAIDKYEELGELLNGDYNAAIRTLENLYRNQRSPHGVQRMLLKRATVKLLQNLVKRAGNTYDQ